MGGGEGKTGKGERVADKVGLQSRAQVPEWAGRKERERERERGGGEV